jgi:hypothetical protein
MGNGEHSAMFIVTQSGTERGENKFYKTKVVGKVCFTWGRSNFWKEGPGPHVLLEQILLYKKCSTPSQLTAKLLSQIRRVNKPSRSIYTWV